MAPRPPSAPLAALAMGRRRLLLFTSEALALVLEHAHPGEEEASPPGGSLASSPCAELELAFHDLSEHAGIPVSRAGQAVALLRDLGLADLGKRFGRLSSRRRGAAHPDAPFLADLRRSLDGLDSGFVASTAAAFLEAGRPVQRQADDSQSGRRHASAAHPSNTSTGDSAEPGSSEDLGDLNVLQLPADLLGGIAMPAEQLPGEGISEDGGASGASFDAVPENLPMDGGFGVMCNSALHTMASDTIDPLRSKIQDVVPRALDSETADCVDFHIKAGSLQVEGTTSDSALAGHAATDGDASSAGVAQGDIQRPTTDRSVGDAVIDGVAASVGLAQGDIQKPTTDCFVGDAASDGDATSAGQAQGDIRLLATDQPVDTKGLAVHQNSQDMPSLEQTLAPCAEASHRSGNVRGKTSHLNLRGIDKAIMKNTRDAERISQRLKQASGLSQEHIAYLLKERASSLKAITVLQATRSAVLEHPGNDGHRS